MCRSIKPLFNFEPPAGDDEVYAASLQFVRTISGFTKPSKANEAAFLQAVDDITAISRHLLTSLETHVPPKSRSKQTDDPHARSAQRLSSGKTD